MSILWVILLKALAEKVYDHTYGARPLKRAIQKYIENPLSLELLKGNFTEGAKIEADAKACYPGHP